MEAYIPSLILCPIRSTAVGDRIHFARAWPRTDRSPHAFAFLITRPLRLNTMSPAVFHFMKYLMCSVCD